MPACLVIVFCALAGYLIFLASSLYVIGFVATDLVPKSSDVGGATNWSEAIVVDLLLPGASALACCRHTSSVGKSINIPA